MKNLIEILTISVFALLLSVSLAFAQTIPEKSTLPVDQPIDVGGTVLQPGVYAIHSMPESRDRTVIQITSVDGKTVYATALTVPHHMAVHEQQPNTTFVYYPAREGHPRVLRTWFPPDPVRLYDAYDIVYEEARARELAALTNEPVVSYRPAVTPEEFATAELQKVTPETTEPYTPPTVAEPEPTQIAEAQPMELPRTAGIVPLLALLGLAFLGAASGLRMHR